MALPTLHWVTRADVPVIHDCSRCGCRAEMVVRATGTGWASTLLSSDKRAERLAAAESVVDLSSQAALSRQMAPCPGCGRRNRRTVAIQLAFMLVMLGLLGGAAIIAWLSNTSWERWLAISFVVAIAAAMVIRFVRNWRGHDIISARRLPRTPPRAVAVALPTPPSTSTSTSTPQPPSSAPVVPPSPEPRILKS